MSDENIKVSELPEKEQKELLSEAFAVGLNKGVLTGYKVSTLKKKIAELKEQNNGENEQNGSNNEQKAEENEQNASNDEQKGEETTEEATEEQGEEKAEEEATEEQGEEKAEEETTEEATEEEKEETTEEELPEDLSDEAKEFLEGKTDELPKEAETITIEEAENLLKKKGGKVQKGVNGICHICGSRVENGVCSGCKFVR